MRRSWVICLVTLLILAYLAMTFSAAWIQNLTYDERVYYGAGKILLDRRAFDDQRLLLHPPLGCLVSSLPIVALGWPIEDPPQYQIAACRAVPILLFGVPLLLCVFLWTRELRGDAAAVFALVLAVFLPELLAHSGFITPDLPITSLGFISTYLLWRWLRNGRPICLLGCAAVLGLAFLVKLVAALFLVAIVVILLMALASRRISARRALTAGLIVVGISWLVLRAGYGFAGVLHPIAQMAEARRAAPIPLPESWHGLAAVLPVPFLQTTWYQWSVSQGGWLAFLHGQISITGWWYYYLYAMLIKLPIALWLFLIVAAVGLWWRRREWLDEAVPLIPVLLIFAHFSFVGKVNIGLRYMLPIFPFLFVFASGLLSARWARRAVPLATGGLLTLWYVAASLSIWPDYLGYFNELVGPKNGYKHLADSNVDWNQNRYLVDRFVRSHPGRVSVNPEVLPDHGTVIVGAHNYQLPERRRYRVLRDEYDPGLILGHNWLVFDLERDRRFPRDDVRVLVTDRTWQVVRLPAHGPGAVPPPRESAVVAERTRLLDPQQQYPGTSGVVLRSPDASPVVFVKQFALERPPVFAKLYLVSPDDIMVWVNDTAVAAQDSPAGQIHWHEWSIVSALRSGPNELRVGFRPRSVEGGVLAEARIAIEPARP